MEVLKVKVDFKKPSSGSISENPKIYISRVFKLKTVKG
jgi:hypothetical protein